MPTVLPTALPTALPTTIPSGAKALNSSPYACVTRTLPSEPAPNPAL